MAKSVRSINTKSMPSKSMKIKMIPMENQQTIPLLIPPVTKNITGKRPIATAKQTAMVLFFK